MPLIPSIGDFRLAQVTCELRYADAFLIFDHTGAVIHRLRTRLSDVDSINASPTQTTFRSNEGAFALEINQSRITAADPDTSLEGFGNNCKQFFDVVCELLDIRVFTRIGLRLLFRKKVKDIGEASDALSRLKLLNLEQRKRFNAADQISELLIRWEGEQTGATLRLKAETGKIDVVLPPELDVDDRKLHRDINNLLVDTDYYTVAPVESAQWDPSSWVPQSLRVVKKELDFILSK